MAKSKAPIIHKFSRKHARTWRIPEAILLGYMAARVRKSKNWKQDKRWFYNTAEELSTRFPYWNPNQVDEIIQRLREKKLIEVGNFNKWTPDRTRWFTVSEEIMKMAAEDPVYFYIKHAERYGIRPALILFNLENNIQSRQKKDKTNIYHPLVPNKLAKLLPISEREIERIIKELREAGAIVQQKPKSSLYSFPSLTKATPPKSGTPPSETGQTPSESGEPPPKTGSNTHYNKPFETTGKPFETPQASPAAETSSSEDTNKSTTPSTNASSSLADHFATCDYADLEERCKEVRDDAKEYIAKLVDSAAGGCERFISDLSPATIYQLGELNDPDKLLYQLLPILDEFFEANLPSTRFPSRMRLQLFTFCLDMLISAFLCVARHTAQDTAVLPCRQRAYDLCLKLGKVNELEEFRRDKATFEQSRINCASVDADKETVSDLPPAEKARVLRNAVRSSNLSGWFYATEENIHVRPRWVNNQLIWSHGTLAMAERFFARNLDASATEVVEVLDRCVRVANFENYTKGEPNDPYWNTRRAVDVSFFFARTEEVLRELGSPFEWIAAVERSGEERDPDN